MGDHQQLEKRLGILERKLVREKKARNLAEQQLEEFSREIYLTNVSLKESLDEAKKKQQELAYLRDASSIVISDMPIGEMLANVITLTGWFLGASAGFFFYTHEGSLIQEHHNHMWFQKNGWQMDDNIAESLIKLLPVTDPEEAEHWLVTPLDDIEDEALAKYTWAVYVNFKLLDDRVIWMALLSQAPFVDEEALYVLDTAKGNLTSGIKRRLGELKVRQRNAQLQKTVSELEQARQQLVQSEKMASLGQLAAGVAHEINNPVGFIRSNTEVLVEYLSDINHFVKGLQNSIDNHGNIGPEELQAIAHVSDMEFVLNDTGEVLKANLEGVDRIRDIIESLKTFSHSGENALSPISLYACIENALKVTANALKYKYKVINELPESLPEIMGDLGQLQQVFVNLLINASHAMPDGGTIRLYYIKDEAGVTVCVEDNGAGMDEETKKRLFTPFYTTKPVGVGTGLGLSVSYAILEAHNASISVQSEIGQGTTFFLSFPLA